MNRRDAEGTEVAQRNQCSSLRPLCDLCVSAVRILCLGNELLGDDAFGVLVARELENCGAEVVASSASGLHLLDQITGCERLIVIDTVETGMAEPGTVFVLAERELPRQKGDSPHCMGLLDALALARTLGLDAPSEVTFIAVEAADCRTVGGAMDPRVAAAISHVVVVVRSALQ